MPIDLKFVAECRRRFSEGQTPDEIIAYMRRAGLSKMESLKVLVDLGHATPTEAKRLVHLSPVWKDAFQRDEKLHDQLESLARGEISEQNDERRRS